MKLNWLSILAIGCSSCKDGFKGIFLQLFAVVGAFVIVIGIGAIIGYLNEKNWVKHEWQIGLILLIIALSIIALVALIK